MKNFMIAIVMFFVSIPIAQAQPPAGWIALTCDPGWTTMNLEFKIFDGENCCNAGAKVCAREVSGQLEIQILGVYVEDPCSDDIRLGDLRDQAFAIALQENVYPLNTFTIPPCNQGAAYMNVKQIQGTCQVKVINQETRTINGMSTLVDVTYYWDCYYLTCEKSCSVCYTTTSDPCNDGKLVLEVDCNETFVPLEQCPGNGCIGVRCTGSIF